VCKRGEIRAVGVELDMRSGRNDHSYLYSTSRETYQGFDEWAANCFLAALVRASCWTFKATGDGGRVEMVAGAGKKSWI